VAFWTFHRAVEIANILLIAEVEKQSKRNEQTVAKIMVGLLVLYVIFYGFVLRDLELFFG